MSATKQKSNEEFVRSVLTKSFKQTVDRDTLRQIVEKVDEAISTRPVKVRTEEAA